LDDGRKGTISGVMFRNALLKEGGRERERERERERGRDIAELLHCFVKRAFDKLVTEAGIDESKGKANATIS